MNERIESVESAELARRLQLLRDALARTDEFDPLIGTDTWASPAQVKNHHYLNDGPTWESD